MLLVLDNFEQLLDAARTVSELLDAATGVKVLVTSRAPLRLAAEHAVPVPPLALPDPAAAGARGALAVEAVALFLERARAVAPSFAVTDENAPAVAEICVRLDGLPLAIELAAARVKLLPPQALLARLEPAARARCAGGARDRPERQQTLRAAIDWSYDLLDADEQKVFARLGVFAGGFRLDAAEAICGADLDGVDALLDNSLVRSEVQPDGEPRFFMLETIREYATRAARSGGSARRAAAPPRALVRGLARAQGGRSARGAADGELGTGGRGARQHSCRPCVGS